ncbi:MAG TPA: SGNH/GDSL hydrolase family protein [Micromonosporaceae bacterium]
MTWRSYVAVGDSFTEGLDDPYPSGKGYRGWADLVAQVLAQRTDGFAYANLAIRGKLFDQVVDQQVPVTLRLEPDLVSFAAGGNDALRRNFDPAALITRFDDVVRMLRASGADVLLFRFADLTRRLPGKRVILPRATRLNEAAGEVAEKYGAYLVDLWADEEFANPRLWSEDRLHLSAAGHRRVAAHALIALGLEPDPDWLAAPPPPERISWAAARAADFRWASRHLAPWVKRRLTGRSSGDLLTAKRPELTPF